MFHLVPVGYKYSNVSLVLRLCAKIVLYPLIFPLISVESNVVWSENEPKSCSAVITESKFDILRVDATVLSIEGNKLRTKCQRALRNENVLG